MDTTNTEAFRAARDFLLARRLDYEAARDGFAWPALSDGFNWAIDWFDAIAAGVDRPALVVFDDSGRREVSFEGMRRRSNQVAHWLAEQGVGKGDVVLLMLGNQVELWESMLAIMKLGAIILPATTSLDTTDLAERVERAAVNHVITNAGETAKFVPLSIPGLRVSVGAADGWTDYSVSATASEAAVERPGGRIADPLLRYFTSGTTSKPKLVEHDQVSYPAGHLTTLYWIGLKPGDVHLNISSPGWAKHAWSCFFAPWNAEATIAVYNYDRFRAEALLGHLEREAITTFCAPPTVWRMLIKAEMGERPAGLRELIGAGEPLNPEVIGQVERAWGLTIRDGFGQTETSALIGNSPGQPVRPGSMGRPLPGAAVVLVDPLTGEPVETGEGEICLDCSTRPVNLMKGYAGSPSPLEGRFYHTGDLAERDADGYITYIGRTDDVFKASDYKISPFELESVLIEHPAVAEAAIVPCPDPLRLAVPKAYVALAPGHAPDAATALEILRYARLNLAPWQRVRRLEFAELPKTISGKIRRVELRAHAAFRAENGPAPDAAPEWCDSDFPELRSGTLHEDKQPAGER